MNDPKKVALKRLKRKRKLEKRIKCHGTKEDCSFHFKKIKPVIERPQPKKKESLWQRILGWIKNKL